MRSLPVVRLLRETRSHGRTRPAPAAAPAAARLGLRFPIPTIAGRLSVLRLESRVHLIRPSSTADTTRHNARSNVRRILLPSIAAGPRRGIEYRDTGMTTRKAKRTERFDRRVAFRAIGCAAPGADARPHTIDMSLSTAAPAARDWGRAAPCPPFSWLTPSRTS